jgi:hypothetical protein
MVTLTIDWRRTLAGRSARHSAASASAAASASGLHAHVCSCLRTLLRWRRCAPRWHALCPLMLPILRPQCRQCMDPRGLPTERLPPCRRRTMSRTTKGRPTGAWGLAYPQQSARRDKKLLLTYYASQNCAKYTLRREIYPKNTRNMVKIREPQDYRALCLCSV